MNNQNKIDLISNYIKMSETLKTLQQTNYNQISNIKNILTEIRNETTDTNTEIQLNEVIEILTNLLYNK